MTDETLVACILLAVTLSFHKIAYAYLFIIGEYPWEWAFQFVVYGVLWRIVICGAIFGLVLWINTSRKRKRGRTEPPE